MGEHRLLFETPAEQKAVRKASKAGIGCLSLIVLIIAFLSMLRPYTDFLWYTHDARQPEVFTLAYATKGFLFSAAFVFAVAFVYLNLKKAFKVSPVYDRVPETSTEQMLAQIFDRVQTRTWIPKVASLVLGLLYAGAFSGEWQSYLLWKNGGSFGKTDPLFGKDIGFYTFDLPFLNASIGLVFGIVMLTTLICATLTYGLTALAKAGNIQLDTRRSSAHTSLLIGLCLIVFGIKIWFARYSFTVNIGSQFTGAGYAATQQLAMTTVLSILTMIGGVAVWGFSRLKSDNVRPLVWVGGSLAALWFLGVAVWPGLVQRFKVDPDKLNVEAPFAARAIGMTRWAYGLDKIGVKETNVQVTPTDAEVEASKPTLEQMRLWDPEVLRRSIDSLQGFRPYYSFNDVDVDRYMIGGVQRQVMVAARDVEIEGLQPQAQNWVNQRLQYTHGYGIAMAPTNTATRLGQPQFIAKDVPISTISDIKVDQPRLYFSDFRNSNGDLKDPYALVRTRIAEFDYPTESETGSKTYKWTGDRGVPVSGFLAKAAYAILFNDGNLFVSRNIDSDTRILYRRSVIERAQKIYPFLRFDQDPYLVVYEGRLLWIIDGYTTTNAIPYSEQISTGSDSLNYIRNSVKVVIDGYLGETTAYAIETDEPVLQAYRKIYPGLVKDLSALPKGLNAHFRYAEDMFMAQASMLTQYHVTDPTAFLNNEDAWEMPHEIGLEGRRTDMKAYYVQMQLPSSPKDEFLLILPFTPRQKNNMSGWLAARCDPEHYGQVILYRYPKGSNMPGPAQMESKFNQDNEIANLNKLLNSDQSRIVPGNLLVVPIGQSILYVKPLFIQSASSGIAAIPELRKVILSMNDTVVVADSYQEALAELLGTTVPVQGTSVKPAPDNKAPTTKPAQSSVDRQLVQQALDYLKQAEQAQRSGDWAKYGELQKKAREALEKLVGQ